MSKQSDKVYGLLREIFPQGYIKTEHYVRFKGKRLFFDFFLPQYKMLIEVQGRQHYEFVKHFHSDIDGFKDNKKRDNLKIDYASVNDMCFIIVDYNENINKHELLKKMIEAQNG